MPVDRASTVPRCRLARPDQREIAALHRAAAAMVGKLRGQRLVRGVVLAATISRWCPCPAGAQSGRRTPPMPDRLVPQWAISALTNVPEHAQRPDARQALGLVDDDDVGILVDDVEGDISPPLGGPASGTSIVIVSPLAT